MHTFDICPCPALYPYYHRSDSVVVVVDVLRAGTSIVEALGNGAREIIPVASLDKARSYARQGYMVAAERNAQKCEFAQLGNDPAEFSRDVVYGQTIVMTTTNGTQAINAAHEAGASLIVVGAFSNVSAIARLCAKSNRDITVLASGWQNQFCLEDTIYGGALLSKLNGMGVDYQETDCSRLAKSLYKAHQEDLASYLYDTDHNQRLIQRGYPESLSLCIRQDTSIIIPSIVEDNSYDHNYKLLGKVLSDLV